MMTATSDTGAEDVTLVGNRNAVLGSGHRVHAVGSDATTEESDDATSVGHAGRLLQSDETSLVGDNITVQNSDSVVAIGHDVTVMDSDTAVAIGNHLQLTSVPGQVVVGRYNKATSAVFVVGSGVGDTTRSNALEVDVDGTILNAQMDLFESRIATLESQLESLLQTCQSPECITIADAFYAQGCCPDEDDAPLQVS